MAAQAAVMTRAVTRAELREIERRAIEERGIPADVLMENAGRAVADVAAERISPACPVVAVCGRGSNGGDGFVAARLLADRGFEVEVLSLDPRPDPSTAAGRMHARARDHEGIGFVGRLKRRPMALLLDAIFGTGLSREVKGRERALIEEMNALDPRWFPIVAIDLPSGLDADTGRPLGIAVRATATVTLGLPKIGFSRPGAAVHVGELLIAPIGIPEDLLR
jgi:NAD(P)H-hydrate epimerase